MSGIVDWLKSIAEGVVQIPISIWDNVKNIPAMVWDFVKEIPGQVWEFVKQIPGQVWGFFENSFSTLTSVFKSTYDFVITIPEKIFEGIKSIFVPREEVVNDKIDSLKNVFVTTFGIESYDLSNVLGVETQITDQKGIINIAGFDFNVTFLDVTYIVKAVSTFRPYIRGFIVLLMIFYNINQFLTLIGQHPISLGVLISNDSSAPALPAPADYPRLEG